MDHPLLKEILNDPAFQNDLYRVFRQIPCLNPGGPIDIHGLSDLIDELYFGLYDGTIKDKYSDLLFPIITEDMDVTTKEEVRKYVNMILLKYNPEVCKSEEDKFHYDFGLSVMIQKLQEGETKVYPEVLVLIRDYLSNPALKVYALLCYGMVKQAIDYYKTYATEIEQQARLHYESCRGTYGGEDGITIIPECLKRFNKPLIMMTPEEYEFCQIESELHEPYDMSMYPYSDWDPKKLVETLSEDAVTIERLDEIAHDLQHPYTFRYKGTNKLIINIYRRICNKFENKFRDIEQVLNSEQRAVAIYTDSYVVKKFTNYVIGKYHIEMMNSTSKILLFD